MKVGIVTTLDHNIGDDFVREGIKAAFSRALAEEVEFVQINKHQPLDVLEGAWLRKTLQNIVRMCPRGKVQVGNFLFSLFGGVGNFRGIDVFIQSGAPVIFHGMSKTEWAYILLDKVFKEVKLKNPNLISFNLAAGTCFGQFKSAQIELSDLDVEFLHRITCQFDVTTARESLAQEFFGKYDRDVSLIPCSSILCSLDYPVVKADPKNKILINYMPLGGHYDFNDNIDPGLQAKWFSDLVIGLEKKYEIICVAHDSEEYAAMKELFGTEKEICYPTTLEEYSRLLEGVFFGVVNRLHSAMYMFSHGIQSFAIANDTRRLMLEEINISCTDVRDLPDIGEIIGMAEGALETAVAFAEHAASVRDDVLGRYVKIIGDGFAGK
jgi:hypothetical protein